MSHLSEIIGSGLEKSCQWKKVCLLFGWGTNDLTCPLKRKICRFLQFANHCYHWGSFIIFSIITECCRAPNNPLYTNTAQVITRMRGGWAEPDKMGRSQAASDSPRQELARSPGGRSSDAAKHDTVVVFHFSSLSLSRRCSSSTRSSAVLFSSIFLCSFKLSYSVHLSVSPPTLSPFPFTVNLRYPLLLFLHSSPSTSSCRCALCPPLSPPPTLFFFFLLFHLFSHITSGSSCVSGVVFLSKATCTEEEDTNENCFICSNILNASNDYFLLSINC